MAVNIVTVSVSEQLAPAPIVRQQTGAIISQGATTLAEGTTQILTTLGDLNDILTDSIAISTITWTSSVVTVTLASPHGIPSGDTVQGTISGVAPVGYNGTFAVTYTGANTFTYPLVANPGASSTLGVFTLADVAELVAQVTTYFANGLTRAVYVLELGTGTPTQGVTALTTYLVDPTVDFYAYLVPSEWDANSSFIALAHSLVGLAAQTYFYVTTTISNYTQYASLKSMLWFIPDSTLPSNEFTAAAVLQSNLALDPNSSSLMQPLLYRFVYGVTPNTDLTNAQEVAVLAAGGNFIDTAPQGQIIQTLVQGGSVGLVQGGQYGDKMPFTFWYAVDWVNEHQTVGLAAAIINGVNNPQNPLVYNQPGINFLQKVAQSIMDNATSFGLILPGSVVNAVPFATYVAQNPSDYAAGIYNGLSCTFIPQNGFKSITIFLTASNIPT